MRDCPVCGADVAEGVCDFGHAVEPAADDISVRDEAIAATLQAVREELNAPLFLPYIRPVVVAALLERARKRLI